MIQCPPGMGMTFAKPRPMTIAEIDDLVDSFAHAAEVLYKAGADGIQAHAAHVGPFYHPSSSSNLSSLGTH